MRKFLLVLGFSIGCSSGQVSVNDATPPDAGPQPDVGPPPPTSADLQVIAVEPDHGPFTGGSEVVIRGTSFGQEMDGAPPGIVVRFGGHMAEPLYVQWLGPTRIRAVTPAGDVGPADVTVEVYESDGVTFKSATLAGGFVYDAFYVDPPTGTTLGGTFVTIHGQGTTFSASTTVTFGDAPLGDIAVVSAQEVTGMTPPGAQGPVDVTATTDLGDVQVRDAFSYYPGVSLREGGLGGGTIEESLHVTVVDYVTGAPIPGAYVIVGTDPATPQQGTTDGAGVIVFTGAFIPPIDLTAAADTYETTTFVTFDAREAVIRLVPPPPPPQPGGGQGPLGSFVKGVIQFGGPSGIGTDVWDLVPEPATPTQSKCARVRASIPNLFYPQPIPDPPGSALFGDVPYVPGQTAWPFFIFVAPGTMAIYALAGICDSVTTPPQFTAYAMGIHRGVLAGPGETVQADIVIDLPLDKTMDVTLQGAPPNDLIFSAWPARHYLAVGIDLGGDGILLRWDSTVVFPNGTAWHAVVPGQTDLVGPTLSDGSYLLVGAADPISGPTIQWPEAVDVDGDGATFYIPMAAAIKRGVTDITAPIVVDGFVGIPHPVDPPPYGTITNRHLEWTQLGAPAAPLTMLTLQPVWRMFVDGSTTQVDIPDLAAIAGLPDLPSSLQWELWNITPRGDSYDFDSFVYRDALYWPYFDAFSVDRYPVTYTP
jgi:IPT/TIG domain-containing protein